jgi:hypothetical protein
VPGFEPVAAAAAQLRPGQALGFWCRTGQGVESMMEEETSKQLRARFEALVHAAAEPLRKFLLRRTDADTAEDVRAETLLVLWRRIDDVHSHRDG